MDRVTAYATALLEVARAEGRLTDVEDDLYRFAEVFSASDDLRMALIDPGLPADRRVAVIEELMGGKALPQSTALVGMIVAAGRAHDLPEIVQRFVEMSAQERDFEVAEVRTAVSLTDEQRQRLTAALAAATGKRVEVRVVVDPSVLGGIVARVGDIVIDGSVRHRLDQLKEQIA
ncbi:MAG TPA: ATP synthase F1 subunit delta [Acidimicrobiia bacterium]|jgi:F-type H+-transporting ATPase subunit delta